MQSQVEKFEQKRMKRANFINWTLLYRQLIGLIQLVRLVSHRIGLAAGRRTEAGWRLLNADCRLIDSDWNSVIECYLLEELYRGSKTGYFTYRCLAYACGVY